MITCSSRPKPFGILSFALILGACEGADPGPPVVRSDSAGVEIVHSAAAAWTGTEEIRLSAEPLLHIGVLDGPEAEQFTRITSAFWLSDERIVATNFSSPPEVRVFSPEGRHEVSLGGSGAGPGEFSAISLAARLPGDTLLVHDFWNARLTYFDPSGALLRTQPLVEIVGAPASRWVIRDVFEDGTLLVFENHLYPGAIPGHRRAQRALVRVAPTGQLTDTVLVIPDAEYVQDGTGLNAVLFGLRSGWHVGEGDRVYVATGEEFRLDVYDTGGVLLRSLRRDYDRPAVRPEHIEAERERRLAQAQTDEARRRVEETLRELRIADLLPASGQRILVDADANVWLKHYEPPGASSREWSVFGSDGRYLGGVQVPPNFQIMEIRNDRVLGVWIDELDVPAVRIYELERSSG